MKRMTQILTLGLLLSISSVALAGRGNDRNHHDGYHGGQRHSTHHYDRHHGRHGHRHHAKHNRHARRHSHHGRYCHDGHPRGYVAPRVRYGYSSPGVVLFYQPDTGLYIEGGY